MEAVLSQGMQFLAAAATPAKGAVMQIMEHPGVRLGVRCLMGLV